MSRISVFKQISDIVDLRDLLYGSYEDQVEGLSKCKAYEVRGFLPASVHATCLLVSAVHGDVPENDLFSIRLQYSMAIIRFVNEILDASQTGKNVTPLHSLAEKIGLPNSFVELRHAATHEDIPSIHLLRRMTSRGLQWLYQRFWALQTGEIARKYHCGDPIIIDRTISSATKAKEYFKQWRRIKRENKEAVPSAELTNKLCYLFKSDMEDTLRGLIDSNIMVPNSSTIKPKLVISMYLPLFLSIGTDFLREIANAVVFAQQRREWPVMEPSKDITTSNQLRIDFFMEEWAVALAPYLTRECVEEISGVPRPWNARIVAAYACKRGDKMLYDVSVELAEITGVEIMTEWRSVWMKTRGYKPLGVI